MPELEDKELDARTVRAQILDTAKQYVTQDRSVDYDTPESNFEKIAALWMAYLGPGFPIEAHDVAVLMALVKVARISSSPTKLDHWVDLAGYAACGGEVRPSE